MSCDHWRELASARLDGELAGDEATALDAHLATCPACRSFAADAADLGRAVRVRPAEPVPDLYAAIMAAAPAVGPTRTPLLQRWSRLALAWLAIVQLALALPALLFGDGAGMGHHVARHLGSFDVAIAIGLLYAAWRPERARSLLPVVAALAACLVVTSVADLSDGSTTTGLEAHHVLDMVGFVLLWLVAGRPRPAVRDLLAVRP